jgi:hypothetical protein
VTVECAQHTEQVIATAFFFFGILVVAGIAGMANIAYGIKKQ